MLAKRVASALVFIPVCLLIVIQGGWLFTLTVVALLSVAAWEFWRMFRRGDYLPNGYILVVGVALITLSRIFPRNDVTGLVFTLLVLVAMGSHTLAYEKGATHAGIDFAITVCGLVYVGWLGSYLVLLRFLPDGLNWIILSILGVGFSDMGAYLLGSAFGRHKISTRVSPGKSLEGYLGGILCAVGFGAIYGALVEPSAFTITPLIGALLCLVVSVVAIMGDLGESLLKRQFGIKDSSNIIPGHGGILDRIDTWLWAGAISYYLIIWFWS